MDDKNGLAGTNDEMVALAGADSHITDIQQSGMHKYYKLAIDNSHWYWVDEMFEDSLRDIDVSKVDLDKLISF
jgi:hypothetical protein